MHVTIGSEDDRVPRRERNFLAIELERAPSARPLDKHVQANVNVPIEERRIDVRRDMRSLGVSEQVTIPISLGRLAELEEALGEEELRASPHGRFFESDLVIASPLTPLLPVRARSDGRELGERRLAGETRDDAAIHESLLAGRERRERRK